MAGSDSGMGAGVMEIGAVTAVPAVAMALGSAAISAGEPSEQLQARLQHFSAGLLIGAVITDIFPILRGRLVPASPGSNKQVSWANLLASVLGFGAALLLMYGLKSLGLDEEAAEGGEEKERGRTETQESKARTDTGASIQDNFLDTGSVPLLTPTYGHDRLQSTLSRLSARVGSLSHLVNGEEVDREAVDEEVHGIDFLLDAARRSCRRAEPIDARGAERLRFHATELQEDIDKVRTMGEGDLQAVDTQLKVIANTLRHLHGHVDRNVFRRWRPQPIEPCESPVAATSRPAIIPLGLVLAVIIDSMVDGMLIGLAGSVDIVSGWLMAMATAIEMGFLGYSFACSLVKTLPRIRATAILALPPLTMLAASAGACACASGLKDQPAFVGLIAFALVALLFLVVEELLLEAHEKEDSDSWHISVWLYVGLLLSIVMDVAM